MKIKVPYIICNKWSYVGYSWINVFRLQKIPCFSI